MKIVKLLILAAVISGVIWLIPSMADLFKTTGIQSWEEILSQNDALRTFDSVYNRDWEEHKEWDTTLYRTHCKEAAHMKSAGEIDSPTYDRLMTNINNTVLGRLVSLLEKDYRSDSVPEKKVENNLSGLDSLSRRMQGNKEIAKMKGAWSTYLNIRDFVSKTYSSDSFSLGMSGDGSSWTSFNSHKSRVLSDRDRYRQNAYYKEYFKNNRKLSSGLASVESKVEGCRSGYNRRVLNAIKQKYGSVPKFNTGLYFSAMRSARNESEWNIANRDFENAWASYESGVRAQKQKLGAISTTFKNQVGDISMQTEMSTIAASFTVPKMPSIPSKPYFQ